MDCLMFWYLPILLHLLFTCGTNASCNSDILFSGPSNLCSFVLQILDSHLGSHFSNFKLSEFYAFKNLQLNSLMVKRKSVNYLSSWYYMPYVRLTLYAISDWLSWISTNPLVHNDQPIYWWCHPQVFWKSEVLWLGSWSSKEMRKSFFFFLFVISNSLQLTFLSSLV